MRLLLLLFLLITLSTNTFSQIGYYGEDSLSLKDTILYEWPQDLASETLLVHQFDITFHRTFRKEKTNERVKVMTRNSYPFPYIYCEVGTPEFMQVAEYKEKGKYILMSYMDTVIKEQRTYNQVFETYEWEEVRRHPLHYYIWDHKNNVSYRFEERDIRSDPIDALSNFYRRLRKEVLYGKKGKKKK